MTALTKAAFLVALPPRGGVVFVARPPHRRCRTNGCQRSPSLLAPTSVATSGESKKKRIYRSRRRATARNVAEFMKVRSQPQAPMAAELPVKSVAHLEDLWAQIGRGLGKR